MREKLRSPGKRVCTVHCGSFKMHCMLASSTTCKLSFCADRAHACAGDSYTSNGIDVACPTTQNVLAIDSPHELHGDSWPSSSTDTSTFCCNHQYSITAVTTSTGAVAERYAYTAYGQPTILDASASVLSSSAINNRYTFTGREWDATLALNHFRARWMSGLSGRFVTRDPIGFDGGSLNIQEYCHSKPFIYTDPTGMQLLANPLPPVLPPPTAVPIAPIAGTVCRFAATRVCTPVAVGVTSYQCGKFVSYYTLTPICVYVTEWICEATQCQTCPTPPAPVTDTTHDHGDCLTKTGSVTHWHYFVYHQDPKTCVCYGPYRRFGGCSVAP